MHDFRDIINYCKKFKDCDDTHLSIQKLILHMANQCTKWEVSSLSRSRDILGGLKIFNGSHEVTTTLSETVSCP